MVKNLLFFVCFIISAVQAVAMPCFIAVDEKNNTVCLHGSGHDVRISPCSTFKIVLSLIGFDSGILIDEQHPLWLHKDQKTADGPESWKADHGPQSWMKNSVVWYSQKLTQQLGLACFKNYLALFDYGNHDMSGDPGKNNGLAHAWLCSSLKISAREQVHFLRELVLGQIPVSPHAVQMTKKLLYEQTLANDWRLYGKTGTGFFGNSDNYITWYVGWLEKDEKLLVFALNLQSDGAVRSKEERVKMVVDWLSKYCDVPLT